MQVSRCRERPHRPPTIIQDSYLINSTAPQGGMTGWGVTSPQSSMTHWPAVAFTDGRTLVSSTPHTPWGSWAEYPGHLAWSHLLQTSPALGKSSHRATQVERERRVGTASQKPMDSCQSIIPYITPPPPGGFSRAKSPNPWPK